MRVALMPLILTGACVAGSMARADYAALRLEQLVRRSDAIVRVRVIEVERDVAPVPTSDPAGLRSKPSVAVCSILETLKGRGNEKTLKIQFDPHVACPGVGYRKGEECVVFLTRKGEGPWTTLNWDNGKKVLAKPEEAQEWRNKIKPLLTVGEGKPLS